MRRISAKRIISAFFIIVVLLISSFLLKEYMENRSGIPDSGESKPAAGAKLDAAGRITVRIFPEQKAGIIPKSLFGIHAPAWNESVYENGNVNPRLLLNIKRAGRLARGKTIRCWTKSAVADSRIFRRFDRNPFRR